MRDDTSCECQRSKQLHMHQHEHIQRAPGAYQLQDTPTITGPDQTPAGFTGRCKDFLLTQGSGFTLITTHMKTRASAWEMPGGLRGLFKPTVPGSAAHNIAWIIWILQVSWHGGSEASGGRGGSSSHGALIGADRVKGRRKWSHLIKTQLTSFAAFDAPT